MHIRHNILHKVDTFYSGHFNWNIDHYIDWMIDYTVGCMTNHTFLDSGVDYTYLNSMVD